MTVTHGTTTTDEIPRSRFIVDPDRDREFAERGFVVLPDILGPEEVRILRDDFLRRVPVDDHGMKIDFVREDRRFLREGSDLAVSVLAPHVSRVFVDHVPLLASYVTKWPGDDSTMALHEDRTYVDPDLHVAANLWITLDDVGPDIPNGGLYVVPFSNAITPKWVGSEAPDLIRPYEDYLIEHAEQPAVSAGSAIIYDNRTLHGSAPNRTTEVRAAVAYEIVPRGVEIIHALATSRRHRKVYRIDADFLLDTNPTRVRESDFEGYPLIREFEDDYRVLDEDVLAAYPPLPGSTTPLRAPVAEPSTNRLRREPRRVPRLHEDIPFTSVTLPGAADAGAGWGVERVIGELALVVVADPEAGIVASDGLPDWAGHLRPFVAAEVRAAIVVIDERATGTLSFDGGDDLEWRLDVVDVSFARGFLSIDGHEEVLDEDVALVLRGAHLSIWNHGPGALVVLVSASPAPAPAPAPSSAPEPAQEPEAPRESAVIAVRRVLGRIRRRLLRST